MRADTSGLGKAVIDRLIFPRVDLVHTGMRARTVNWGVRRDLQAPQSIFFIAFGGEFLIRCQFPGELEREKTLCSVLQYYSTLCYPMGACC